MAKKTERMLTKAAVVTWPVFLTSAVGILSVALWAIIDPTSASVALGAAVTWIANWFGSFYIVLAAGIVVFVLYLGLSKYGHTRLGTPDSRPEFSNFSWAAMLFAAGIGTDILFFSVAEPVAQYMHPPLGPGQTVEAARSALVWTLFHYGITGWGMYSLMGIALGYFAYREGKPLAVRYALASLLGTRTTGLWGHVVDSAAIIGTIFGVATTMGIGVVQLSVGLQILFGTRPGLPVQIALVAVSVLMTVVSATTGVDKGIQILSRLNVYLALFLAGWIFVFGKPDFLMRATVMDLGNFISTYPERSLETFAYTDASAWMSSWTLFFWAWWVAWASFVGMFLARISRGRTFREFIVGALIIPFTYVLIWISIFGNSAIARIRSGDHHFAKVVEATPEKGFYLLLQNFPLPLMLVAIATIVGLLFYVTSADSGALVMANLCIDLPDTSADARAPLRIFWVVITGVLTIGMLLVGGIPALQSATIIMGLPFSFVLIFVGVGLMRALRQNRPYIVDIAAKRPRK
ncbi:MAG: BCCT family transporter [Actinomycetaceae bacterium]|nr:BCCT family transporter [Actinomycetaceae bacterium]